MTCMEVGKAVGGMDVLLREIAKAAAALMAQRWCRQPFQFSADGQALLDSLVAQAALASRNAVLNENVR